MNLDKDSDRQSIARDSTGVTRRHYNFDEYPPSTAVIELLAEVSGSDPTTLPPLFEYLDPDALDSLIRSTILRGTDEGVSFTFLYDGFEVTVHANGVINVQHSEA